MSTHKPNDDKLQQLLLGQLPPDEAEQLSATFADDSRVVPVAESLDDDTLLASVRGSGTEVDVSAEDMSERLVGRLKADMTAATQTSAGAATPGGADEMPPTLEYFKLERELGHGGMGTVYLAQDTRLGRPVAIKTLKAELARKPAAKERFFREARVAAALEHESVVPIYYVGEDRGIPFLAMPVLKGRGLDDHLKANGGRLPVADVLRIAAQAAGGLAAAHAVGLIHRDIKPSNLWVDADGRRVRVLDFGLARFETDELHLTASGMIVGTPAYMAPEQARGRAVDARADLFSLGVVMYQMLTGQRPFSGSDTVSVLSSLALDTPPAPNVVNFDVPSELSDLVMRLLEKEPHNRPASAEVVRAAVDRLAVQPTEDRTEIDFTPPKKAAAAAKTKPKPAPAATRKSPLVPLAVALGLLALLVGGAVAVYQLTFNTKDGTLVVELDDEADVRFKNGKLEVYDDKGVLKYTLTPSEKNKALPPGKYTVKVVGADGVKLDTESFEIERNGKRSVKVTATGPTDVAKKPDPVKPDPNAPGTQGGAGLVVSTVTTAEAPNPGLDVTKPWTAEAYFTPLTDDLGTFANFCQLVGVNGEFNLGVTDGKYYGYSHHGDGQGGVVKVGERVHLACVQTDKERLVFVNGKSVATAANLLQAANRERGKLLFKVLTSTPNESKVLVDGVRISQAVRYTKDFTPPGRHVPDKDTLALYHCDEGQGDKLTDSSSNNLHGKITNAKWGKASAVSLPPWVPGTPLALRKPTWKPGPADNTLPGLVSRPAILDGVGRWQIVPTVAYGSTAWTPDGKLLATTDADYLRVYDAATGAMNSIARHGTPPNHWTEPRWSADSKWVLCGVSTPQGVRFVTVFAADGTPSTSPPVAHAAADFGWNPKYPVFACLPQGQDRIQIFDPTQAKPIEIDAKTGPNGKAVWSPDGEWLLVAREDKSAQLFGRDGKPGAKLDDLIDPSCSPVWSADGTQLAALVSQSEVGFWKADGTAGKQTGKHGKPILALHWRPDGKLLAVSDAEGKRHFWKTDGTSEGVADTKDATPGFVWAKDGRGFFTPGKFWPAVGNASFTATRGDGVWDAVSPDQTSVAQAKRGEIAVTEWNGGETKDIGWKVSQSADGIPTWSPDGKRLLVADGDGLAVYDPRDPKKLLRVGGGAAVNGLNRAAFSPKADRLAVASSHGTLTVCEPTGKVLRVIPLAPAVVGTTLAVTAHDLQWHPDGKLLAVTTGVGTVTVFDTETGKAEATTSVFGHRPGGSAIFSPANPDHLLIAHPDAAALWRWKVEKEPLQKFDGLGKLIPSLDGKRVLSLQAGAAHHGNEFVPPAILSPDLKDRDTAGTKEFGPFQNHPGPSLAWHPDGKHLVVARNGHEGRSITIRSLDGKVVEEIKPEGIDVTWLEWVTPVAKRNVLVGRADGTVYLFDLNTKKLTPIGKVSGELTVSPDGKHLIALEGSTLTYWNLDTKVADQKVVLLSNAEFVTLSPAGEVLEKSANADNFYRYVVEDKTGKLILKTPAEMAPSLPK